MNNAHFHMYYNYANDHLPNLVPLEDPGWSNGAVCRNGQFVPPVTQQVEFPRINKIILNYDDAPQTSSPRQMPTLINKRIVEYNDISPISGPERLQSGVQEAEQQTSTDLSKAISGG